MFFGYNSEGDMRLANPCIDDNLIKAAKKRKLLKCSSLNCVGSIDGKEFLYKDKSSDEGIFTEIFVLKVGDNIFSWETETLI